jgi:hypothetical protein
MATIRVKRSTAGTAPSSLANAEIAFAEAHKSNASATTAGTLFYGLGTGGAGGTATTVLPISGPGSFLALTGTHSAFGTYTFAGGVTFTSTVALGSATATTQSPGDTSTAVATTAFVKSLNYLTTNQSISISGDATGTGTTSISVTIPSGTVTNAKLATVSTATIKGRVSTGTGAPEDLTPTQAKSILAIVPGDITGFDTQVQTNPLNTLATATGNYNMGGFGLTNLVNPTNAQDAATKAYVDNASIGLEFKASVKVATTANITLSGTQTIDGVSVLAGDRVLVKNQTTASQNGLYVAAAGAWARSADANSSTTLTTGSFVYVDQGTLGGGTAWVLSTTGTITVGTTSVSFNQFSGAGGGVPGNYAGQTSITTLGDIGTGVWQATTIAVGYGGTGLTSAVNGLLKGNGSAYSVAVAGTDFLAPSSDIDGGTF